MAHLTTTRRPPFHGAFTKLVLAVVVATGAAAFWSLKVGPQRTEISGHVRIIDGDSLMVGGTEVRLYGIDAPELFQRCTREGREVQCGREAARALIALVAGQQVTCERRDIDRYGRTVAVCRADGVDLARAQVANGQAVSYGAYFADETAARSDRKGLWAGEFIRPREWRDRERGRFAPGA
jgi:endonuclease YncB( thermonuclease family)